MGECLSLIWCELQYHVNELKDIKEGKQKNKIQIHLDALGNSSVIIVQFLKSKTAKFTVKH